MNDRLAELRSGAPPADYVAVNIEDEKGNWLMYMFYIQL